MGPTHLRDPSSRGGRWGWWSGFPSGNILAGIKGGTCSRDLKLKGGGTGACSEDAAGCFMAAIRGVGRSIPTPGLQCCLS